MKYCDTVPGDSNLISWPEQSTTDPEFKGLNPAGRVLNDYKSLNLFQRQRRPPDDWDVAGKTGSSKP